MFAKLVGVLALVSSGAEGSRKFRRTLDAGWWRAEDDASRIRDVFASGEDARKRYGVGGHGASGMAEELSRSSAIFEKYSKDFASENDMDSAQTDVTSEDERLANHRHQLEMEGNFAAAEELNPFEHSLRAERSTSNSVEAAAENGLDDLAVDALYAAGKWGKPARRSESASSLRRRDARLKEEEKAEKDEFTLESGLYAFEHTNFDETIRAQRKETPRPTSSMSRWGGRRAEEPTEKMEVEWTNPYAHAFDSFDEAKMEKQAAAKRKQAPLEGYNLEDVEAEETAQRFERAADGVDFGLR